MGKILRGCRAKWIGFETGKETLVGKGMDTLSTETNPETEQTKDVLGESSFEHNGYTPSVTVEYTARTEDEIYPHIQKIANTLAVDDETITATLTVATLTEEVKESDTKTLTGTGYQVPVKVVVTSDGGGTAGYQIPFTAYESGNRIQGTVSVTERKVTFTPETRPETEGLRNSSLSD